MNLRERFRELQRENETIRKLRLARDLELADSRGGPTSAEPRWIRRWGMRGQRRHELRERRMDVPKARR